uniref:Uncharacterized protein n=1 Tax=Parastrongyloides trichosuri TaxID=131310 RepID=A0A0N5A1K4_PARTI
MLFPQSMFDLATDDRYWVIAIDVILGFLIVIVLVTILALFCKLRSQRKSYEPIKTTLTEVVLTPKSTPTYMNKEINKNYCLNNLPCRGVVSGDDDSSGGDVEVYESGNTNVNIFFQFSGKDTESKNNSVQYGKIEEMTTKTLDPSSIKNKYDKKIVMPVKASDSKESSISSKTSGSKKCITGSTNVSTTGNDPPTLRYTSTGEPLSSLSSKQ